MMKGRGARTIKAFKESFEKQLSKLIKKYARNCLEEGTPEHAFSFGEQQIKGHITAAIDRVCDSYFIQEYQVDRSPGKGRVDYWLRYGADTKITVLLEVKHYWIRLYESGIHTIYAESVRRHKSAREQLRRIRKREFANGDYCFTVALTILPAYARYPSMHSKILKPSAKSIDEIARDIRNRLNGEVTYFLMRGDENQIDEVKKDIFESYPAMFLVWSVTKIHRDRR